MRQLQECARIQEHAKTQGFRFTRENEIALWEKVEEEFHKVVEAALERAPDHTVEEFGDLLFMALRAARFYGIDLGEALRRANEKFNRRFQRTQGLIMEDGRRMHGMPLSAIAPYWQRAKEEESNS